LVARTVRDRKVGGSNPLAPTTFLSDLKTIAGEYLQAWFEYLPEEVLNNTAPAGTVPLILAMHGSGNNPRSFVDEIGLLAGELVNADQQGACAGMNAIINELPKTIPNSYVISSRGCTSHPDHRHFNASGHRELGRRYGLKMLSLIGFQVDELQ
jgi:hypothetical protein